MKAKKAFTVLVALSTVCLLTAAFTAEARAFGPYMQKRGGGSGIPALRGFLDLKLSVTQQEAMTQIIDKYRDQREGLRSSMLEARRHLREAMQASPLNEEEARKAFREASSLREEAFVLRARMMTELKGILNPEQIALLKDRKDLRMARIKRRLGTWLEQKSD